MSKLTQEAEEIVLMAQELYASGYQAEALAYALAAAQRIQLAKLLNPELQKAAEQ